MNGAEWMGAPAQPWDRRNHADIGKCLGPSSSVINRALHDEYKGRLTSIQIRLEAAHLAVRRRCLVFGEIPPHPSIEHQNRDTFRTTSTPLKRMHRTGRTSEHKPEAEMRTLIGNQGTCAEILRGLNRYTTQPGDMT